MARLMTVGGFGSTMNDRCSCDHLCKCLLPLSSAGMEKARQLLVAFVLVPGCAATQSQSSIMVYMMGFSSEVDNTWAMWE